MYDTTNTTLDTWFERDRAFVGLSCTTTDQPILDVWDEDVESLVEDGSLDPRDWHRSAADYASHLQLRPTD